MKADGKTEAKPIQGIVLSRRDLLKKKLAENIGMPISRAMREVGYSKEYSRQPQALTTGKKWRETLEKYLPDDDLAKKHNQLLSAGKILQFVFRLDATDEEIKAILEASGSRFLYIKNHTTGRTAYFTAPDSDAQLKALDLAYKVKGKMVSKTDDNGGNGSQEIQAVIMRIRTILPDSDSS